MRITVSLSCLLWKNNILTMNKKQVYCAPAALQVVRLQVERTFLDSVVEKVNTVETAGQKIEKVYDDISQGSTLNHTWEN